MADPSFRYPSRTYTSGVQEPNSSSNASGYVPGVPDYQASSQGYYSGQASPYLQYNSAPAYYPQQYAAAQSSYVTSPVVNTVAWQSYNAGYSAPSGQYSGYGQVPDLQQHHSWNGGIPGPTVTTIKPNYNTGPVSPNWGKPGMMKPAVATVKNNYVAPVAAPVQTKPVVEVQCDAGNHKVKDLDIYSKKCFDPTHSVCYKCLFEAYLAKDSPACPCCQREYSDGELIDIHQLMSYTKEYGERAGRYAKKSGAGVMVACVFGHDTHKDNIIPEVCPNNCAVCRMHYEHDPKCVCGQMLGMKGFPADDAVE